MPRPLITFSSPRRWGDFFRRGFFPHLGGGVLSVLSGILLGLPFCDGRLWMFAWFGLLPLFFALKGKDKRSAFWLSYICGLTFWSITIYWLIHVTLLGQILLILYLALYFGLFGFIVAILSSPSVRTAHCAVLTLVLPSLWVILEYARAHFLTGFGWAHLGFSQYLNLPVIQISDITGSYGVSFLIVLVNVTLAKKIKFSNVFITIVCLFITLIYGFWRLNQQENGRLVRIAVIQPNIPQEMKWDSAARDFIFRRLEDLTGQASLQEPRLIIWPESALPGILGTDKILDEYIINLSRNTRTKLLLGAALREYENYYNSALLFNEGRQIQRYDKLHLVPFGEYIPFKKALPFLEAVVPIGDFTAGREFTLFNQETANFAVLICFEDTVSELARSFVRKGADFLINITNDGWYKDTSASFQHLMASVFRAVETRKNLVRSANTGISCFIGPCGRIISRVGKDAKVSFVEGFKVQDIILSRRHSPYVYMGDIFVLSCFAFIIFCGILEYKNETRI